MTIYGFVVHDPNILSGLLVGILDIVLENYTDFDKQFFIRQTEFDQ
jgi:hypothetical protein